jgi:hypothetical protein
MFLNAKAPGMSRRFLWRSALIDTVNAEARVRVIGDHIIPTPW